MYVSTGLTPAARTRRSTCPGPTCGSGASSYRRTSGSPGVCTRMAFMSASCRLPSDAEKPWRKVPSMGRRRDAGGAGGAPLSSDSPRAERADARSDSLRGGPGALDLFRVCVGVLGEHFQPLLRGEASGLAVDPLPRPVRIRHAFEDLRGGGADHAEQLQGRLRWPIVEEPAHVATHVERSNPRSVFRDETAQADGSQHLAVGEVVDDLPDGPFAGKPDVKVSVLQALQGFGHHAVSVLVLLDQLSACNLIHRC